MFHAPGSTGIQARLLILLTEPVNLIPHPFNNLAGPGDAYALSKREDPTKELRADVDCNVDLEMCVVHRGNIDVLPESGVKGRGVGYVDGLFVTNGKGGFVFRDYTSHTMRIFYLERGGGASNLHMKFNLRAAACLIMPRANS